MTEIPRTGLSDSPPRGLNLGVSEIGERLGALVIAVSGSLGAVAIVHLQSKYKLFSQTC